MSFYKVNDRKYLRQYDVKLHDFTNSRIIVSDYIVRDNNISTLYQDKVEAKYIIPEDQISEFYGRIIISASCLDIDIDIKRKFIFSWLVSNDYIYTYRFEKIYFFKLKNLVHNQIISCTSTFEKILKFNSFLLLNKFHSDESREYNLNISRIAITKIWIYNLYNEKEWEILIGGNKVLSGKLQSGENENILSDIIEYLPVSIQYFEVKLVIKNSWQSSEVDAIITYANIKEDISEFYFEDSCGQNIIYIIRGMSTTIDESFINGV